MLLALRTSQLSNLTNRMGNFSTTVENSYLLLRSTAGLLEEEIILSWKMQEKEINNGCM